MTALRVVDQYIELSDVPTGSYTPTEINTYLGSLLSASYVVTSSNPFLPNSRVIVQGSGIVLTDDPASGTLTISSAAFLASFFTGTWRDPGNAFVTTGSVSIDTTNRIASTIGTDVFFFVSGSISASSSADRKVAVFGGDVVFSGSVSYPDQVTTSSHETLRQLIHLADSGGPFNGFSGAVRDRGPYPFTTASIWWTDMTMTKKIVEKLITRNANSAPSSIQWKAYGVDGTTVVQSMTDNIVYNGAYEISRTRTSP